MEELRGTFENSATDNLIHRKSQVKLQKERKHCLWSHTLINTYNSIPVVCVSK